MTAPVDPLMLTFCPCKVRFLVALIVIAPPLIVIVPSEASSTLASPTTSLIFVPFLALIFTPSLSN
jgi:hypothetical protein